MVTSDCENEISCDETEPLLISLTPPPSPKSITTEHLEKEIKEVKQIIEKEDEQIAGLKEDEKVEILKNEKQVEVKQEQVEIKKQEQVEVKEEEQVKEKFEPQMEVKNDEQVQEKIEKPMKVKKDEQVQEKRTELEVEKSGERLPLLHSGERGKLPLLYSEEKSVQVPIMPNGNCSSSIAASSATDKPKAKLTSRQWTTLIILALVNVGEAMTVSIQAPFYPAEAESKGATATEYGLVFGVFELVIFLVSPIYGKYIMKIGPKFLLNAGIFTTSICSILFGLLDRVNGREAFVALSFIIRIIQAIGEAGYITASFSLIAKEFPDSVATTFALLETCFGIGILCGPTLGGALFQVGGYMLPFIVLGGFLFVAACITLKILPSHDDDHNLGETSNVLAILKIVPVAISALSVFSGATAIGFISATLEPHIRQFQLSPLVNGFMFIISGGVYGAMAPVWGRLCDKVGQTKLFIVFAALSVCISFTLLGPAPFIPVETTLWLCIVGLVFQGIGAGGEIVCAFLGSLKEAVKHGYPDDLRTYGLVSALWSSAFALGAFVGPSIGGLMLDTVGFRMGTLFIIGQHGLLAMLILSYLSYRKWKRKHGVKNLEIAIKSEQEAPLIKSTSKV